MTMVSPPPEAHLSDEYNKEAIDSSPSRPASQVSSEGTTDSANSFNPDWRFVVAFTSLSIITLMAALDATSISVALPIMARVLHGTAIEAFWAGTSFLLTSTVFQPVLGNFSNIFGRKPIIFLSLTLFGIGAIVAALAKDFGTILVGRSIQGIGGGGVIVMTEIVATDLVPLRERGKWFGFISSMWALGTVVGPLLGGGFAQNVSWTWIFWINLPFIGVGAAMIILFLKLNYKTSSFVAKLKRVDWIGSIVFVGATTGVLIPITWGGVMYPWDSWRTLFPLIFCAISLIAFVFYEAWLQRKGMEPVIRLSVMNNRTAGVTFFTTFIHGIILWSILYYLPLYYEAVKGFSPILTSVALFPQTFTVAPASIVAGVVIAITGKYRMFTWFGWAITTFGMGLLLLLKVDTSTPAWIFLNLVSGIGTGVLFSAMAITVQASASNADQAHAVTSFALFRALGQTIGVATGGVIFQNQMRKELLKYTLLAANATEWSKDASGLVEIIKGMPDGLAKDQLKLAYVDALKYIWIFCCALAGVAFVASLWTKALPLDREHETEQGFKQKKKTADEETKVLDEEKKVDDE